MEFKELLEKLQNTKINQKTCLEDFWEDLPDDLYKEMETFEFTSVDSELDIDKHRWYEKSTDVYKDKNSNLLGVRGASQLYSESSMWSDLFVTYEFFEMEEIQIISYKKKKLETV